MNSGHFPIFFSGSSFFPPFFVSFSLLIRIGVPTLVSAVARTSKSGYVRKKQKKTVVFFLLLLCVCVSGSRHPHFFFFSPCFLYTEWQKVRAVLIFFSPLISVGTCDRSWGSACCFCFLFLRAPPAFLFYIIPRLSFPLCVAVVVYLFVCCVRVLGSLCIYVLQLRKE